MVEMAAIENLSNAIITQAALDYRSALRKLRKKPDDAKALSTKEEIEKFFHSSWFALLSRADGDYIIEQIRME